MVAELLASPLVIRPFSAKLSHSSSLSFVSFLFLASSNALVFCSFDLQLLCKKYISGPFPQSTVSETVPKVSYTFQSILRYKVYKRSQFFFFFAFKTFTLERSIRHADEYNYYFFSFYIISKEKQFIYIKFKYMHGYINSALDKYNDK